MNESLKQFATTVRCAYKHCQIDVPIYEAATLKITTTNGVETYKGNKNCLEAIEEEIQGCCQ